MANFNQIIEQYRAIARSNTDVGNRFEHLIRRFLLSYQYFDNDQVSEVWLWNEWPYKAQFGGHDIGIDLVAITTKGDYWAVQCKCQAAETVIDKAAVDSFLATSGKTWIDDQQNQCSFKLCVFVSTTNNWSSHAVNAFKNRLPDVKTIQLSDLEKAGVDWILLSKGVIGSKVLITPYELRPHQQDALDAVHEYFKTNDRGKLIMACGTGKTFTALRIAEHETGANGFVLCLVPSIALLRQLFLEWHHHKKTPMNFVWICSDPTASRNKHDDELNYDITELPWPATTDVDQISKNLMTCLSKPGMTVVFSTYQSIDVVANVQKKYQIKAFDLIICDEAHRTTGVKLSDQEDESHFIKVHQQKYINGKKRLYMTATPLIYHDTLKTKLDLKNATYISMDDETNYGHEIYRLSFGNAVAQDLLTNYKLMILAIDEKDLDQSIINFLWQNKSFLVSKVDNHQKNIIKLLGCINALKKTIIDHDIANEDIGIDPMQRAVAFCGNIHDSKDITTLLNKTYEYERLKNPQAYVVSAQHMDGTMHTTARDELLLWLETADINPLQARVLTNVRCLNEGVDVPALDAVMFLSAQSSKINIVQSIGRVMRNFPGKKFGYIILPVITNNKITNDDLFTKNYPEYQIIWNVINALLAHDASFDEEISKLTYNAGKYNKHNRLIIGRIHNDQVEINNINEQGIINDNVEHLRNLIKAKIIPHQQMFWLQWDSEINKIYKSKQQQIINALEIDNNFCNAFHQYYESLKNINNHLSLSTFIEMIAQHAIMWPIFKMFFKNNQPQDNLINTHLDSVLNQLSTSHNDQQHLAEFYQSIKLKIQNIVTNDDKQLLMTDIYNRFFKIVFPKEFATLGFACTPPPLVDFIVTSVVNLLPIHFSNTTINDHGVYIINPFADNGSFIVSLLANNLIDPACILYKYQNEIYANAVTLLAYYVALINIINSFHDVNSSASDAWTNFWGMRFLDPLQATEANYHDWDHFHKIYYKKANHINVNKPPITIIIGNPLLIKQTSINDQHQTIVYKNLNHRISETYVAQSTTKNNFSLYDSYYKAFRWSTDRLHPEGGGIVSFITDSDWLTSVSGVGFRKSIVQEYTTIYVINLRDNVLTNSELLSFEEAPTSNRASSQTSTVIVLLIKTPILNHPPATIYYYAVDDYLTRQAKLDLLNNFQNVTNSIIPWTIITPDINGDWVDQTITWPTNSLPFRPNNTLPNVFNINSWYFVSRRANWISIFDKLALQSNVQTTINFYEAERLRLAKPIKNKVRPLPVISDITRISWSKDLLNKLQNNLPIVYDDLKIFKCQYRPFINRSVYFDSSLIDIPSKQHQLFLSKPFTNRAIIIPTPDPDDPKTPWSVFITNQLFAFGACFPEHTYQTNPDGTVTTLNAINDHVLQEARTLYNDSTITTKEIFDYLYGLLHHPTYQSQYQNNLITDYPNLIWTSTKTSWLTIINIGRQLAHLHLNFETIAPNKTVNVIIKCEASDLYKVTKMKYDQATNTLIFNDYITITNLPSNINDYQVFGRSPIKWIVSCYQISIDKKTGIINDPNQLDSVKQNPRYLLDLVLSIINLTTQTLVLIDDLKKQPLS